jgi:ribosomal protein S18 acetylase RimI-like enzyme
MVVPVLRAAGSRVSMNEQEHSLTEVRPAQYRDVDGLLTVEQQCFDVYYYGRYKLNGQEFRHYLEDPACIFLVALATVQPSSREQVSSQATVLPPGRPLGYVLGPLQPARMPHAAHIDSIAVLPAVQNQGIGSRLLRSFIEQARQRGCRTVTLEVAIDNKTGLAFFTTHGFREVRTLPHYYGRDLHGLFLSADIPRTPASPSSGSLSTG